MWLSKYVFFILISFLGQSNLVALAESPPRILAWPPKYYSADDAGRVASPIAERLQEEAAKHDSYDYVDIVEGESWHAREGAVKGLFIALPYDFDALVEEYLSILRKDFSTFSLVRKRVSPLVEIKDAEQGGYEEYRIDMMRENIKKLSAIGIHVEEHDAVRFVSSPYNVGVHDDWKSEFFVEMLNWADLYSLSACTIVRISRRDSGVGWAPRHGSIFPRKALLEWYLLSRKEVGTLERLKNKYPTSSPVYFSGGFIDETTPLVLHNKEEIEDIYQRGCGLEKGTLVTDK